MTNAIRARRLSSARRRGALLLVVLALLTLFTLIGLAFVLVATNARRTARVMERIEQQSEPPAAQLHQAFLQAVRGTENRASVLGPHSLLEDLYGNDPLQGTIAGVTSMAGGQMFSFTNPSATSIRTGCVLTMLTGPCAGQSTHIVGADSTFANLHAICFPAGQPNNNDTYVINSAPFSGTGAGYDTATGQLRKHDITLADHSGTVLNAPYALLPNSPDLRRPLMDPASALLGGANEDYDAPDYQNMLLAAVIPQADGSLRVMPSLHRPDLINYWRYQYGNPANGAAEDLFDKTPANSALFPNRESFLSQIMLRPNAFDHPGFVESVNPFVSGSPPKGFDPTIFGRPAMGGNLPPQVFDVDNDGDGQTDSIWVDLGFPVRSTADGRLYKPLFAILCLDMDGRLNVNAHGSIEQTAASYYSASGNVMNSEVPLTTPPLFADGSTGATNAALRRGVGWGPAEVNLKQLFSGAASPLNLYRQILVGDGASLPGRYGESVPRIKFLSGTPGPGYSGPTSYPTAPTAGNPYGPADGDDYASFNRWFEYGQGNPVASNTGSYWNYSLNPTQYHYDGFGSPPDFRTSGAVGLDVVGRPIWASMARVDDHADDPYEINLSRPMPRGLALQNPSNQTIDAVPDNAVPDNPFSAAELEAILRGYDRDANLLPGRLRDLSYDTGALRYELLQHRYDLTTDSWDLPVPPVSLSQDLWTAYHTAHPTGRPEHVSDLLEAKSVGKSNWRDLLGEDLLAGLRMDLNSPFGNGRDDNDNGVVDEPIDPSDTNVPPSRAESTAAAMPGVANEQITAWAAPGTNATALFDRRNNGTPTSSNGNDVRQQFAKRLYVLLMLLADHGYLDAKTGSPDATSRLLAQWAVNVVDFRDRDSIMTRFVFDPDPFDATSHWASDPLVTLADGGENVVWGCERPELLITEALAFHVRETEDLDTEQVDLTEGGTQTSAGTTKETDPAKKDDSFDQQKRPVGSLFVELYNPQSTMEPAAGEFCKDQVTKTWSSPKGVRLNQLSTAGNSPVWRMVIVPPVVDPTTHELQDPDAPKPADRPTIDPTHARTVYFANISGLTALPAAASDGTRYYPSDTSKIAPIPPGRFTVVGPGEAGEAAGTSITYVGLETGKSAGQTTTRQIKLQPNANPDSAGQVQVLNNWRENQSPAVADSPKFGAYSATAGAAKPAAAVVIDSPRRLSISEPFDGYPANGPDGQPYAGGQYPTPFDIPLDRQDTVQTELDLRNAINQDQTTVGLRVIHLQRLANPLLDYNSVTNPYLTVDTAPVDFTAFNGLVTSGNDDPGVTTGGTVMFTARQRGKAAEAAAPNVQNLWKQEPVVTPLAAPMGAGLTVTPHNFDARLEHTLGWLNDPYGPTWSDADWALHPEYQGAPKRGPFPWLTWLNRPFANKYELLLVPGLRSSKLLARNELDANAYYSFNSTGDGKVFDGDPFTTTGLADMPFPHLINFFQSRPPVGAIPDAAELHRFLEYVDVRSLFSGTVIEGNPANFSESGTNTHWYHPPFNRLPTYREPGKINLNTVFSKDVFRGLMNDPDNAYSTDTLWDKFVLSRRGFTVTTPATENDKVLPDMATADPSYGVSPSIFARPFRSFAGALNVPLTKLEDYPIDTPQTKREINATISRTDPTSADRMLFDTTASSDMTKDTHRSPYFRFQTLQKLGNIATTRSNVYAIWITVGYFEVVPWTGLADATNTAYPLHYNPASAPTPDNAHPDGYQLGAELGSDTGEIERHRAFYIFDRSIPVGFVRGRDLNVENAILTRRFIE